MPKLKTLLFAIVTFILILFSLMWLTSYHYYTSVGLDTAFGERPKVELGHIRVRWPGDGSLRFGYGQLDIDESVERNIDLAAAEITTAHTARGAGI